MTDRLGLATGTAEVLAGLRRSLAGDGVTAPLPPGGPERGQVLGMLRPDLPVEESAAAAIVATSGSTGRPRGVVLSAAALTASAAATERRLGGPGTWVLALPVHYIAGVMVLVRSLVADRPVLEVDGRLTGLPALDLGRGPHYLSLVPTQLVRALAEPTTSAALARFDAVLLGGSTADSALLDRARAAGITVVTTYGMSETCGGCVYDGRPLDGVEIDVEPRTGRVVVGGPMLFSGYRLAPEATARTLLPGPKFRTGDRGRWRADRLEVLGRLDAVVISGGHNVDLDAVERVIRRRTDGEIAVVGVPDSEWGTRVVAIGTGSETAAELRDRVRADLPAYALPRQWVAVTELPRTAGGKIDRQRLVADLAAPVGP